MGAASPTTGIGFAKWRPISASSTSRWTTVFSAASLLPRKWVPTARTTSASSSSGCIRRLTQIEPAASGWRSSIAPLPWRVVTTGAWRCSATAASAGLASPSTTPPPAQINGRSAPASSARRSRSAPGRRRRARRRPDRAG